MKNALLVGCGSKFGAAFTKNLADNNYQIDLISSSDFQYKNTNTIHYEYYVNSWWEDPLFCNNDKMTMEFHRNLLSNILFSLKEKNYDLILFNQNPGQLFNYKAFLGGNTLDDRAWQPQPYLDDWISVWSLNYWFGCQLPFYISAYLNNNRSILSDTKVGWMVSGIIETPASANENWYYQDYISLKVHNMHIMKEFAYSSKINKINGIYFCYNPPHLVIEEYEKVADKMRIHIENLERNANGYVVDHDDGSYKMLSHFLG